jgi:hypothetical protein
MNARSLGALLLLAAAGPALALEATGSNSGSTQNEQDLAGFGAMSLPEVPRIDFDKYDSNRDGVLSPMESELAGIDDFARVDLNGDGEFSRQEYQDLRFAEGRWDSQTMGASGPIGEGRQSAGGDDIGR